MVQQSPQSAYSLHNFTILLVEDYDFIKGLIISMLNAFGVRDVISCSNAREAIGILTVNQTQAQSGSARPIDFILTDWMMPDSPGSDLIRWIRNHKNESLRFMPIIMLSTFASESNVIAARDLGANEILVKPVSAEKVASRILSIIDHPRPFIKVTSFFGPDRRRRQKPFKHAERRITNPDLIVEHAEAA